MTPIARQIRELQGKNRSELKEIWRDYFNTETPPYRSIFMRRALAYRIQELTYGGLSPKAEKKLDRLIAEEQGKKTKRRTKSVAIPVAGTRLIREWRGKRYEVIVQPDGFEYDGRKWNSLTAIAQNITGSHWNGLVFFGLRKKDK
ncbi:MAG: DUF2924 domain-containing protein [Bdellovibrionales bacterium]